MDQQILQLMAAYKEIERFSVVFAMAAGMAFAFSLYEWIVIAQREYKIIIKAPWRWANVLYICCRFSSILEIALGIATSYAGATHFCSWVEYALFINQGLATLAGGSIFLLRLMALWNWNKVLLVGMTLLLCTATGFHVYTVTDLIKLGPNPLGGPVCIPISNKTIYGITYLLDGLFDLLILIFTVIGMKRKHVLGNARTRELLLRPTIFYYGVVSIWYWVTAALVFAHAGLVAVFFAVFVAVVSPVVSCRVFLRLREAGLSKGQTMLATHRFETTTMGQPPTPTEAQAGSQGPHTTLLCANCSAPTNSEASTAATDTTMAEKMSISPNSTPGSARVKLPPLPTVMQESDVVIDTMPHSPAKP